MPKILSFDRKNFLSYDSLMELYNSWLNQPLLTNSSPTFENLEISNEVTINGVPVVSSQWEQDGPNIYYDTGNVGIGSTLFVGGNVTASTLYGGTGSGNNLTLRSTTNGTKGSVVIDETTDSTSVSTGALTVAGGVGIAKKLYVGNETLIVNPTANTVGIGSASTDTLATIFGNLQLNPVSTNAGLQITPLNVNYADSAFFINTSRGSNSAFNLIDCNSGSSSKFIVRGDGNVGIGTSNPVDKFEIYDGDMRIMKTDNSTYGYFSIQNSNFSKVIEIGFNADSFDNGSSYFYSAGNTDLKFLTNNIERVRIKNSGNVGIGTSNPASYKLQVQGDINFTGSLYENGVLFSGGSSQWTTVVNDIYYTTGNVGIGTNDPGTNRLQVNGGLYATGNVGIGTDPNISYLLHVDGDINTTSQIKKNGVELILVDIPISINISEIANFNMGPTFAISNEKYFKLENISATKVFTMNVRIPASNITTASTSTTFEFDIPNATTFTNTYDATFNIIGYTTDGSDNVLVNLENCMGYCVKTDTKGICSFTSNTTTDIHVLQITVYYS